MRLGGHDGRLRRKSSARAWVQGLPDEKVELNLAPSLLWGRCLRNGDLENTSALLPDTTPRVLEEREQVRQQFRVVDSDAHRHEIERGAHLCRVSPSLSASTRPGAGRTDEIRRSPGVGDRTMHR